MGKNEVDLMVLGSLLGGPAHGYEIKKKIARSFNSQYPNLSDSAVYPRLSRFEKEGLVDSRIEVQSSVPNRKVYTLTEKGKTRILELAATPVRENLDTLRSADFDDLTVHIVFFQFISKEERRKLVEPYYRLTQRRYTEALSYRETLWPRMEQFTRTTLEYVTKILELTLEMYRKLMEMD
ncbi:MAG TPA: PadR family transcriptional regulator [Methanomassiliicoccales archaeon]|jgi:DNA-binding PadR family transcriptional regulator